MRQHFLIRFINFEIFFLSTDNHADWLNRPLKKFAEAKHWNSVPFAQIDSLYEAKTERPHLFFF